MMLRTILIFAACSLVLCIGHAQHKIGDNTLSIDPASILELESTSKGFLPSRMSSAQRDLQTSWNEGHIIYNTTESCLQIYSGSSWDCFLMIDSTFYKNDGTLTSNRTVTMNGLSITFDGSGDDIVITDAGQIGIGDPTPEAKLDVEGGTVRLSDYGSGTNNGSESYLLGVDSDGDVIEVSTDSVGTDSQAIDTFSIVSNVLQLSLERDSQAFRSVDLTPYLDNQIVDQFDLSGTTLRLSLEDDGVGLNTVDLSTLQDGTGTDDQIIDSLGLSGTTLQIGLEDDINGLQSLDLSSINTDNQIVDQFDLSGTTLRLSLEDDGVGLNTVDLSTLQDGTGTDDQIIDSLGINGTTLQIGLEGDVNGLQSVDLASILGSSENIYNTSDSLESDRVVTMDGNDLTFAGTDSLIITSQGRLGVGTTSPSSAITVVNETANDTADDLEIITTNSSTMNAPGLVLRSGRGSSSSPSTLIDGDRIGRLGFYAYDGASYNLLTFLTSHYKGSGLSELYIGTSTDTTMYLSETGQVGIGTETPSALFHVNGTSRFEDDLSIDDGKYIRFDDPGVGNTPGGIFWDLGNDNSSIYAEQIGSDSMDFVFKIADNEDDRFVFTIDHFAGPGSDVNPLIMDGLSSKFYDDQLYISEFSSRVGVGTDTPAARLDVDNGTVRFSDYGAGTVTGTLTRLLGVDADGDIIEVDTTAFGGSNIYNTSDSLEGNRTVTMDGNSLSFEGSTDTVTIHADGDLSIGTPTANGDLNVVSDENQDAFHFTQTNVTTGERDVFTLEDQDVGGGGQDESSVLKVLKSGAINSGDDGFSLVELANTGTDPGANKYWISGRKTDEGAPLWGVDITDNDFWSEGGIVLGVTGADGGTYSGGNFIVESDGDVGIGTTTPGARLEVDGGSVIFDEYGVGTYKDSTADYILAVNSSGDVVELNTLQNTRWIYAPAVTVDASDTTTNATIDLHQEYVDQFSTIPSAQRSPGAPADLPTYAEDELHYYITFYDNSVIDNISISSAGVLTYDVISVPFDNYTIINVIFMVK